MAERTLEEFETVRRPRWVELAALVAAGPSSTRGGNGRRGRAGATGLVRTMTLVRLVSGDLAWARKRFAGTALVGELEVLLAAARPLLDRPARQPLQVLLEAVALSRDVLQRSRRSLVMAALLLLGTILLGVGAALIDPLGAQVVQSLDARIPPEPGEVLPAVTGLPVGTAQSGTSWSLGQAGGAAALALVGGALVGVGTVAVLLLWGLRLGAGIGLALRGDQGLRVIEGLGTSGLALLLVLVLAAAGGLTVAAGVAGRRPLGEAATDAAVLGGLAILMVVPAVLGSVLAAGAPAIGALVGTLALLVLLAGAAYALIVTSEAPTPRRAPAQPRPDQPQPR